jgi:hypothetical protein
MNTNTTLFTSPYQTKPGHLSPDGTFLVLGSIVYKFTGTQYIVDHTLPISNIGYRQFIDHYPTQLLINTYDPFVIRLYDCQTKSDVFSVAGSFDNQVHFDQASGKVSTVDFGIRKIFDITTRDLREVQVDPLYAYFNGNVFITASPVNSVNYALKDYYY